MHDAEQIERIRQKYLAMAPVPVKIIPSRIARWLHSLSRPDTAFKRTARRVRAASPQTGTLSLNTSNISLQRLADELQMPIHVCHFPPGTSKWNKIEHRLFCFITKNWRGRSLESHQTIVQLISHTTTDTGLIVRAALDTTEYETGIKVSDEELARVRLERAEFHGEWNYAIHPRNI